MKSTYLEGKIIHISELIEIKGVSKKTNEAYNISKRIVVIEEIDADYPGRAAIEFSGKHLTDLSENDGSEKFSIGDNVSIGVNFAANEAEKDGKPVFYGSIRGRLIKKTDGNNILDDKDSEDDGLPF